MTNPDAICCISWDWDIVSCRTQIFCFYDIFRCGYDFGGGVAESLSEAFQRHVDVALTSGFAGGVLVSATYYSFSGKLYYTIFPKEEKKKEKKKE